MTPEMKEKERLRREKQNGKNQSYQSDNQPVNALI